MFTYKTAIARKKYVTDRYIETDLESTRLMDVSSSYTAVYLILEHTLLDEPVAVEWSTLSEELRDYNPTITVGQWLSLRGNASLVTMDQVPKFNVEYVQFRDAYEAGFDVQPIDIGYPADAPGGVELRKDIVLTKDGTDYSSLYHYCLPTVNGLVHRPDNSATAYFIKDGHTTALRSNVEHVGLISFERVGALTYLDVDSSNIVKVDDIALRETLLVEFDQPIVNKILGFVLNGYIHFNNPNIKIVGENTLSICMERFSLLDRWFETHDQMDWPNLGDHLERDPDNPSHVDQTEFWSDEVIKSHFDNSQTFFFAIDVSNLFIDEVVLEDTGLPRRYYSHERPLYPIVTEYGRLREYHALNERDVWVVSIVDNKQKRYRYNTYDYKAYPTVDGNVITAFPWRYSKAYMQFIGTEVLDVTLPPTP